MRFVAASAGGTVRDWRFDSLILPSAGMLHRARQLHIDSRVSLWDGLIVAACLEAGVTVLFSEDIPGRSIPGLDFTNPVCVKHGGESQLDESMVGCDGLTPNRRH